MTTLVFGATGTVGGATLHALAARDAAAIAFVRDAARARERLGDSVEIRIGDLDDPSTIRPALDGIDRVLLCSGHDPAMRTQQLAVLDAVAMRENLAVSAPPTEISSDQQTAAKDTFLNPSDDLASSRLDSILGSDVSETCPKRAPPDPAGPPVRRHLPLSRPP